MTAFKTLITELIDAGNAADLDIIAGRIDRHYQADKITFPENELLYQLLTKISAGDYSRGDVKQYRRREK